MKSLVMLILIYFVNSEIHAQKWRPDFALPLGGEILMNMQKQKLGDYLNYIPDHKPGSCEAELSVFYFRVNSRGKIDSLRVDGNLSSLVSAQIIKNIYKTEGKWRIPNDTKDGDTCWFVYPFFLFGSYGPCSGSKEISFRQTYSLYEIYSNLTDTQDQMGRVIISPNSYAKSTEK